MKLACEETRDNLAVLSIAGEMTGDDGNRLRSQVDEYLQKRIRDFIFDCAKLELVDSRALEALLTAQDQCAQALGQLRLVSLSDNVNQILTITRLADRFTRCDSLEQAIESLG